MKEYSKIDIEFINNDYEAVAEWFSDKLKRSYTFEYNKNSSIRDLFKYLIGEINGDETLINSDKYLQEHLYVNIGIRSIKVQLDFNLKEFIQLNNINIFKLLYIFCPAGGAGAHIETVGTIRINHERGIHKDVPHVHVYKDKYKKGEPFVRIRLEDRYQMKGDGIRIRDIFNKKQAEIIFGYLKNNKRKLIDYYKAVQYGEQVEPIYLDYNGNQVIFK